MNIIYFSLFFSINSANAGARYLTIPCSAERAYSMSKIQRAIARNEVYARHGRQFKTRWLRDYFKSQSWYTENPYYSDSMLSSADKKCIGYIRKWEKQFGKYKGNGSEIYSMPSNSSSSYGRSFSCDDVTVSNMSQRQRALARNEIYARRGRAFKTAWIRNYFNAQSWYSVRPDYDNSMLTKADKKCISLVRKWEKQFGKYKGNR